MGPNRLGILHLAHSLIMTPAGWVMGSLVGAWGTALWAGTFQSLVHWALGGTWGEGGVTHRSGCVLDSPSCIQATADMGLLQPQLEREVFRSSCSRDGLSPRGGGFSSGSWLSRGRGEFTLPYSPTPSCGSVVRSCRIMGRGEISGRGRTFNGLFQG